MRKLRTLELFAGCGGGILAGLLLDYVCIGAVEIDPYCQQVLSARQEDGHLPWFPIFDDIRTFDGTVYRGLVDVVSGGFPCQDISVAGKGAGLDGERSGLWKEMLRVIREVRPRFAFVENVPTLVRRGLDTVLGDLAEIGYDAEWLCLGADDCGAPHHRKRIWILAYSSEFRCEQHSEITRGSGKSEEEGRMLKSPRSGDATDSERDELRNESGRIGGEDRENQAITGNDGENRDIPDSTSERREERRLHLRYGRSFQTEANALGNSEDVSDAEHTGCEMQWIKESTGAQQQASERGSWWEVEPGIRRVVDGMANRVDRIKALGNGQVPVVAAMAWRILYNRLIPPLADKQ